MRARPLPGNSRPEMGRAGTFTRPTALILSRGAYDVLVTRSDNGTSTPITPLPGGDMAVTPLLFTPVGWAVALAVDLINLFGERRKQGMVRRHHE